MTRHTDLAHMNQLRIERLMRGHCTFTWSENDRKECIRVLTEIAEKMNSKKKLNRSDLRKHSKLHCFSLIMCGDVEYPECPLTSKQCLRIIELYWKYMT